MASLIQIHQPADRSLNAAQRQFNRLQEQIGKARAKLETWDREGPAFAEAFAQLVAPLRLRAEQMQRDFLARLELWLRTAKWGRVQKEELAGIFCEMVEEVIVSHELDDAAILHWKALHDRYADLEFDAQAAGELDFIKILVAEQTGLNLDDVQVSDEAELMEQLRARLFAQIEQERQARETAEPPPAAKQQRQTAAQRRRQAEREAAEQVAKQSLREIYRKLASQLHPDRAADAADAKARTALMARANAAYEKQDLLALLTLQLELEHIDASHLLQASDAQLRHFNAVLKEQLQELQAELVQREHAFFHGFGMDVPYRATNPEKLGTVLQSSQRHWQGRAFMAEQDLRLVDTPESTKKWLQALREQAKHQRFFW
jgi:hypothetical protein